MRRPPVAAALLLLAPLVGCSANQATVPGDRPGDELTVRRGPFQSRLLLTGQLEAVESQKVVIPRTPSWQVTIRWMELDGAAVTAGQKVLELDNTQFSGDLEEKRLTADSARNELARKQADVTVESADKEFALVESQIALDKAQIDAAVPAEIQPERDYQQYQLALSRAQVQRAKAEQDLETSRRASEAAIEELRIALARTEEEIGTAERAIEALSLGAPASGILVVNENPQEGRKFQIGDNAWVGLPVMQIPDLSKMKVVARLSDVDDGRVVPGMSARCTLDTYPGEIFEGRVTDVAPVAQEDGELSLRRSFTVVVVLGASDPARMRPGMSVRVEVLPEPMADARIAPRAALDLAGATPRVLLADGSAADVRLGPCNPQECVLEEGPEEGTRLRSAG